MKVHQHPCLAVLLGLDDRIVRDTIVAQLLGSNCTTAGCDGRIELHHRLVVIWDAHSQNCDIAIELLLQEDCGYGLIDIAIVLIGASDIKATGQLNLQGLAYTFDLGLSPNELLHSVFVLDPWAASLAPSGSAGNSRLEPETIGEMNGIMEGIFPFRRHVRQTLLDDLRSG